jgi:hypothetical protein
MTRELYVACALTASILALAGCDGDALAPQTATQIGARDGATVEAVPLSDHSDPPLISIFVASPAQEVRVEVEGGEPFQAISEFEFRVDSEGTAHGRGRLLATNPTAVEYAVMLALGEDRFLRFEGTGVAHDFPRGREQTVRITGSIQLPSAGAHQPLAFVATGHVIIDSPEDRPRLTWTVMARVIMIGDPDDHVALLLPAIQQARRWTWQQNDPAGREGEYFETPWKSWTSHWRSVLSITAHSVVRRAMGSSITEPV